MLVSDCNLISTRKKGKNERKEIQIIRVVA